MSALNNAKGVGRVGGGLEHVPQTGCFHESNAFGSRVWRSDGPFGPESHAPKVTSHPDSTPHWSLGADGAEPGQREDTGDQ